MIRHPTAELRGCIYQSYVKQCKCCPKSTLCLSNNGSRVNLKCINMHICDVTQTFTVNVQYDKHALIVADDTPTIRTIEFAAPHVFNLAKAYSEVVSWRRTDEPCAGPPSLKELHWRSWTFWASAMHLETPGITIWAFRFFCWNNLRSFCAIPPGAWSEEQAMEPIASQTNHSIFVTDKLQLTA